MYQFLNTDYRYIPWVYVFYSGTLYGYKVRILMMTTIQLQDVVQRYNKHCRLSGAAPTYTGFSAMAGTSRQTVSNAVHGTYNGTEYGNNPSARRCFDNNDFPLIRSVFSLTKRVDT